MQFKNVSSPETITSRVAQAAQRRAWWAMALILSPLMLTGLTLVSCGGGGASTTATGTTAATTSATTTTTSTTTTTTPTTSTTAAATPATAASASVASSSSDCAAVVGRSQQVVCYANAFKATLTAAQLLAIQLDYSKVNAVKWSNLPIALSARNGLSVASLSAASQTAADAMLLSALGTQGDSSRRSYLAADDFLALTQPRDYGSNNYNIVLVGTPSTTSPWMLQYTGHHYTANVTINGNNIASTPMFIAIEPQTFTINSVAYEPMAKHRAAIYDLLGSFSATQLTAAQLPGTYTDLVVTPGRDGQFPAARAGVLVSSLSVAQQDKVKTAIEAWVKDVHPDISTGLLTAYLASDAMANTYLGWTGAATNPPPVGAYFRIDGPRLWIEFSAQRGIIFPSQVHFHSVWRDKTADYGGNFSF